MILQVYPVINRRIRFAKLESSRRWNSTERWLLPFLRFRNRKGRIFFQFCCKRNSPKARLSRPRGANASIESEYFTRRERFFSSVWDLISCSKEKQFQDRGYIIRRRFINNISAFLVFKITSALYVSTRMKSMENGILANPLANTRVTKRQFITRQSLEVNR